MIAVPYKKTRILSREEELELFKRFRAGDMKARDVLVESQLPWVKRLAYRWYLYLKDKKGARHSFDEVHSLALEGLLGALRRFNPKRGNRLTTVVAWGVRYSVLQAENVGAVRVPPNAAAISARNKDRYYAALKCKDFTSIDEDQQSCVDKALEVTDGVEQKELCEALQRAIQALKPRHRQVLECRFWEKKTLRETGKELGVTHERVRQLQKRALDLLRAELAHLVRE